MAYCIAKDMMPIYAVEKERFKTFIGSFDSKYEHCLSALAISYFHDGILLMIHRKLPCPRDVFKLFSFADFFFCASINSA